MMPPSVELDTIPVQYTEYAGSALVSADFPDVIDGVAGVIHVDYCLLPVNLELCLK